MVSPLELELENEGRRIVLLPGCPSVIGRTAGADVVLDHGTVGRRHSRFTDDAGFWMVEDAGSPCGTCLDEEPTFGSRVIDEVPGAERAVIVGLHALPAEPLGRALQRLANHPREHVRHAIFDVLARGLEMPEAGTLELVTEDVRAAAG